MGYVSPTPRAIEKDLVVTYPCGSTRCTSFGGPRSLLCAMSVPQRATCGSLLQYTRMVRYPLFLQPGRNQAPFCCSVLPSSSPLESFPVSIPQGDAYGLGQQVLVFCGLWGPRTLPLASEALSDIERSCRPDGCRHKSLRNKQTGSSHQDFGVEDGMSPAAAPCVNAGSGLENRQRVVIPPPWCCAPSTVTRVDCDLEP